ncbi:MAG: bifunctional folylpolyglutamate synthase/dihydrofolate synthase [Proteobacteria bacterium]|nr:bifunctional folylpolyglutamate synthase/dihydrofolate synthase [Pseudomonadota bacterium]
MIITPHWPEPLGSKIIDLGLERMVGFLKFLGHPEKKLPPVVHIAGTNGKGSTLAFLRSMLETAGYKVHVYTSPHLVCFNERIVLAGKQIDDETLTATLKECEKVAQGVPLSFFEGTTAAAILAMSRVPADIVLLETGLGGRLDATNVIEHPLLNIITPISFDHMEFLGDTLAKIAFEKASIMKKGTPCVVSKQQPEAREVIQNHARDMGVTLFACDDAWTIQDDAYISATKKTGLHSLGLKGAHQKINAATAVAAIEQLTDFKVTDAHIIQGLQNAEWPARLQALPLDWYGTPLSAGSELWLDGGHNQDGGKVLADFIVAENAKQPMPTVLVMGMLANKDIDGFIKSFEGKVERLIAVSIPKEALSAFPRRLESIASQYIPETESADSVKQAVGFAEKSYPGKKRVVICGSLYLAGTVLAEKPNNR